MEYPVVCVIVFVVMRLTVQHKFVYCQLLNNGLSFQGHMYRSGQTMQYYLTPQPPPPPPPPIVNTENAGYCTYEGQYMQYCESMQTSDVSSVM